MSTEIERREARVAKALKEWDEMVEALAPDDAREMLETEETISAAFTLKRIDALLEQENE